MQISRIRPINQFRLGSNAPVINRPPGVRNVESRRGRSGRHSFSKIHYGLNHTPSDRSIRRFIFNFDGTRNDRANSTHVLLRNRPGRMANPTPFLVTAFTVRVSGGVDGTCATDGNSAIGRGLERGRTDRPGNFPMGRRHGYIGPSFGESPKNVCIVKKSQQFGSKSVFIRLKTISVFKGKIYC